MEKKNHLFNKPARYFVKIRGFFREVRIITASENKKYFDVKISGFAGLHLVHIHNLIKYDLR